MLVVYQACFTYLFSLATRPTIKDVARAAEVSQATAFYVLNNNEAAQRMTKQTQQRVRAAAERLGYKFDPIDRALQRGYTNQVTLLGMQSKDLEVELFVDLLALLWAGGGQQVVGQVHEQAQVAGGMGRRDATVCCEPQGSNKRAIVLPTIHLDRVKFIEPHACAS